MVLVLCFVFVFGCGGQRLCGLSRSRGDCSVFFFVVFVCGFGAQRTCELKKSRGSCFVFYFLFVGVGVRGFAG